jgi:hypothetical protein
VLERERRGGVADGAVRVRSLALELRRAAGGRADERAVLLVGGLGRLVADRRDDRAGVEPGDSLERAADALVGVEQRRRREARELQRAERGQLLRGVDQARRDDRAAGARGGDRARPRLGVERHPVAAEAQVADRSARRGEAAGGVVLGALGEADQREPPGELVAVAPGQDRVMLRRGPRPRAARVGEVRDVDGCAHN